MSASQNDRRKHILEALRKEKEGIIRQLRGQTSAEVEAQHPPSKSSVQIPVVSSSPAANNYTFNKFHNGVIQQQMRLTQSQIAEQERLRNQEMEEVENEDEEEEEEEYDQQYGDDNGELHYDNQIDQQQHQEDGQDYQEGQYEGDIDGAEGDHDNGEQQYYEEQEYNEEQYDQQDHYQRAEDYYGDQGYAYNHQPSDYVASGEEISEEDLQRLLYLQRMQQQQEGIFEEEDEDNHQQYHDQTNGVHMHQHHQVNHQQPSSQRVSAASKKYNQPPPPPSSKKSNSSAKELKAKLMQLKEQRTQRQNGKGVQTQKGRVVSERIEQLAQKKKEHLFHPNCKQQTNEEELKRDNIHKNQLTEEERYSAWLRLHDDRKYVYEEREELRQRIEDYKIDRDCYVHPKINERSAQIAAYLNQNSQQPVETRLIEKADRAQEVLIALRQKKKKDELSSCTFHPVIEKRGSAAIAVADQLPLHERFNEVAKRKQEIIHQLRIREQIESKTTFQPEINRNSALIAESTINNPNVAERLNLDYMEQQYRRSQLQMRVEEEKYKECRFTPITNAMSSEIVKSLPFYDGSAEFVERQSLLEKESRERRERIAQNYQQNEECSFKPQINYISEMLVSEDESRLMATQSQKIDRLSVEEAEKRKKKLDAKEREIYAANTFTPAINNFSRSLVEDRHRTLDELAFNYAGKAHIAMLQEEQYHQRMRECSFYPSSQSTASAYSHIPSYYNQEKCEKSVKIETEVKERKLRELRKMKMKSEMNGCTFTPATNPVKRIDTDRNASEKVKGFEKFLETKDKAEKQKTDKLLREEQLFQLHKKYDPVAREKTTVPVPFNLSHMYKPHNYLLMQ